MCATHGGRAPQVREASEQRQLVERARAVAGELVMRREGEMDGDPLANLVRMVRVAAAAEQAYASLCSTLGDILVEAPVRIVGGITAIQLAAHPYLQLWNEERDRLAKVCKLALDAGVAERQVRIAEGEGGQIHDAMLGLLTDLGLDGEALLAAKRKAAARLRVMAGGAAA